MKDSSEEKTVVSYVYDTFGCCGENRYHTDGRISEDRWDGRDNISLSQETIESTPSENTSESTTSENTSSSGCSLRP